MGDGNPGSGQCESKLITLRNERHGPAISGMAMIISEVCAIPPDHQLVFALINFREPRGEQYLWARARNGEGPEHVCTPLTIGAGDKLAVFFWTSIETMLKRPHMNGRIIRWREAHLRPDSGQLVLLDPEYEKRTASAGA